MRYEEYMKSLIERFRDESLIPAEDFPRMNLYMDQVVEFMDEHLRVYAKDDDEPVITRAMISNYAKHRLMPRAIKKKYYKQHMIMLSMIFYLKGTFQMNEIEELMKPFVDNYGSAFEEKFDLYKLYETIYPILKEERRNSCDEIQRNIEGIKESIWGKGVDDDDTTELLSVMLYLAVRADSAKFAAGKLLSEYFSKNKEKVKRKGTAGGTKK